MQAILGMRSTADYANNQVQWDWADAVLAYDLYGELPLTALMSRAKTLPIAATERKWFDKDYDARVLTTDALLSASVAGASETITLTGGAFYAPATMILFCEANGEHLRVTTDPTSPTSLTVSRGWGLVNGATVQAIPSGSTLTLIGTAAEEGSGVPTPVNTNPFELFNFTQIFKTPYTITGTDKAVEHRTGDPWKEASAEAAIRHMKDIEYAMFLGKRANTIGNGGKRLRTMGGLREFIKTNIVDWNGSASLDELEDFTTEVAKYGNRDIFTMCGDKFVTGVNRLIRGQTNYMVQAPFKLWGYDVSTVVLPNAVTLRLITHPMLNGHPEFRGSAWLLHMADLARHPVKGRDTHVEKDILANGTDAEGEQIMTEMTISVRREKNFGFIKSL